MVSAIDPRWIDVDFEQHAKVDGFVCGTLPRQDVCGSVFPVLEDQPYFRVIPRDERKDLIRRRKPMRPLVAKIKDQKSEGSCASNAAAQVVEIVHNFTIGVDNWVELSAMSLYKRVGRSASSGSTISDNLRELRDRGILPVDSIANKARFKHTHPATGFSVRLPDGWEATGKLFALLEWFDVRSWDGLQSALHYSMPVLYGRAGHAIAGVDPALDDRDNEMIDYANSWGKEWGDQGHGYDSERVVASAIGGYGAWAARVVAWVAMDPLPMLRTS